MKNFLAFLLMFFFYLNCFSQKIDSTTVIEKNMKGFWISTDKSSAHRDSLYFGDNGNFYAAQYHSSDTGKGYNHHVGRWWINASVYGGFLLEVSCASMEHERNFSRYEAKLIFNKPFFFWGVQWHKLQ